MTEFPELLSPAPMYAVAADSVAAARCESILSHSGGTGGSTAGRAGPDAIRGVGGTSRQNARSRLICFELW